MHAQRTGTNAPQTLSFDHAETPRAQADAQLAHVPISPAQLEYQLNTWAMRGEKYEKRNEAKQRILEAHRTGADRLDLHYLDLNALPECIWRLTNLKRLDLEENKLTTLPQNIGALTNLQILDLNVNRLSTLPEKIENLTKLQTLNLDCNLLTTLPERIGDLTHLQSLYLGSNRLTTLSESIEKLTNLQTLDLRFNKLTTLPESIGELTGLKELSVIYNPLKYLPSALAGFQKKHKELKVLPLCDPVPSQGSRGVPNIGPAEFSRLRRARQNLPLNLLLSGKQVDLKNMSNIGPADFSHPRVRQNLPLNLLMSGKQSDLKNIASMHGEQLHTGDQAQQDMVRLSVLETRLQALQKLPPDLNRALADLKKIDIVGEQLNAVAQAQQGMVSLCALPKKLASIPQCAQFYQVALKLLLRNWFVHKFVASQVMNAEPRPWVTAIQALFKAAPVPGLSLAGFGFAALVNQIDNVMKANKGQLLLDRFNNSEVMFEQVAHTVASHCTERLESELRALPENNNGQKPIGLGKQLKALYSECEELAQRLNLQAKPLVNPRHPAANKADELMSLLLHKLCAQPVDEGRAGAMPQAHEDNFAERMSNYCVELLLPNASNTLVVGRKLLGHKAFALAPNGGSSQGRAASPPRSISPNPFARAMAEKDAAIANLEQRITDLQAKAEAASTLAETADRNASEAKQQISIVGLSKQSPQQIQHNVERRLLTQSHYGTEASQGSMGFQPAMGMGQYPIELKTLNERMDTLDHKVADLRQFDLLDTPLSALEYGRVVTAYLQEHRRLHSDGTVKLNNKQGDFKNRKLLEKLKDIHNVENRGVAYNLCIELPALLKKMPDAAYMNPRIPRNTMKLQELLDAEKTGLQKPCPKGETASGNFDINSERSQLLGLGNRFQGKKHP